MKLIRPEMPRARLSVFFIAIRFGTSSPKTIVKNERISVMRMTDTELIIPRRASFMPRDIIRLTSGSEKLSAAKAELRKPAKVIATWIVERKRAGVLVIFARRFARLSPFFAIASSLASFIEMIAISAAANIALRAIRIT